MTRREPHLGGPWIEHRLFTVDQRAGTERRRAPRPSNRRTGARSAARPPCASSRIASTRAADGAYNDSSNRTPHRHHDAVTGSRPTPTDRSTRRRACSPVTSGDDSERRGRRAVPSRLPPRRGHLRRRCSWRCRCSRPLLLEGEAGVGKTELAKTLAAATGGQLIRLQCYEGIDVAQAVYDWDYARQLLHLRAAEATGETSSRTADDLEAELYGERFLIKRALLRAIEPVEGPPPVLLIDEIDRADDEFEAYLLEVLSDYQITIPEVGVFTATRPPLVVLTSNRTRDVHDALKRRCLYHWVEHPGFEREVAIVKLRVPGIDGRPRPAGGRCRRGTARAQPLQAARRRRDHRLGHRPRTPRRHHTRRTSRRQHARNRREVPRRQRARRAARHRRPREGRHREGAGRLERSGQLTIDDV